ncbi:MAG: PAS domain S-box protein [Verrucomicrobiota bacterium]
MNTHQPAERRARRLLLLDAQGSVRMSAPADALRAIVSPGGCDAELRRRAEERLSPREQTPQSAIRNPQSEQRLVHELQVHQIELEMQNEELRQARAQAGALMARYVNLYDFAPTGYLTLDREGAMRQLNLNGARLLGVERSRLLNRRFGLFVAEGDRRAFSDFLERVFASQTKECCEVTLSQAGPHPLFVRIEGTRSGDGQECLAVVLDITERKRAEAALRESESRFRTIFDSVSGGMFLADLETRKFETCNTMCSKMLGYTEEDFARLDISDLHPAEDLPLISEQIGRIAQGKPGARNDIRFRRKDGTLFFTDLSPALVTLAGRKFILVAFSDITERKRTEEKLRKSEGRLQVALEAANAGTWSWDVASNVSTWDKRYQAQYGFEPGEPASHEAWMTRVHPEDRQRLQARIRALLEPGPDDSWEQEFRALHPVKGVRWMVGMGRVERDPSGRAVRIAGLNLDITERKRAEEERERILRWRQSVNLLHQSLLAPAPLEDKLRHVTDSIVRLFGADFCRVWLIRPGDLCKRGCVHAEAKEGPHVCRDRDRCLHLLASSGRYTHLDGQAHRRVPFGAYKIGRVASGEDHKFLTNDVTNDPLIHNHQWARELGLVSFAGYQLRIPGAETLGVLALFAKHPILPAEDALLDGLSSTLAEVIQQAQAEATVRASEEQYRGLFEGSRDAIMTLAAPSWRFTSGNPATVKMFGVKNEEEFIVHGPWELSPERQPDGRASAEKAKEMIETAVREGCHFFEWTHRRIGGQEFPADVLLTRMEQGKKVVLQATVRDITERTQLEQQLRQSQKMEAVGQLAGGVAHDFNNMLAVIRGNAELILMEADRHTAQTKEGLKQVVAASERAANLTRQLLAFSRKQVMQSRPLVLNDVLADLTKMLRRIIGEHIDLQCRYSAELPFVQADTGMIEQVLVNLAVNARDAMPHGGQLLITTEPVSFDETRAPAHPEAHAGQFVCLTVKDAGTGISPEHLPRIFEPFFTTKEPGKGTGLGLATVYGIVKQHQGWIEVSSQPGAGATFKIFLPAIPPPVRTAATPQTEAGLPAGTETILLVEDEHAVRMITRRVLESHGYKIYEATTAGEARDLWRSRAEEIALLLTDIVMPEGVTGRDLAEQLRASRPTLKVILMSGYSADVIGKDTSFLQRSKTGFLQKPCSTRALLETVRRCLDGK